MILSLEIKKLKRTGFITTFLAGGIMAALIPVLDMAFRFENYAGLNIEPLQIILGADWQMMSMLNILLVLVGACIMYHIENADKGIEKMRTLPMKESRAFLAKFFLLVIITAVVFIIEMAGVSFISIYWFSIDWTLGRELAKNFSYMFLMIIPSIGFSLLIASICSNMWVSLGIGVLCVFIATLVPTAKFILSIFPFAMPFQMLQSVNSSLITSYCVAACIETVLALIGEAIYLKGRRSLQ